MVILNRRTPFLLINGQFCIAESLFTYMSISVSDGATNILVLNIETIQHK